MNWLAGLPGPMNALLRMNWAHKKSAVPDGLKV
jgi:hypothetical protein